jgi:hypothetical protein
MSEQVLCKDCKHSFRKITDWLAHGSASYAYSCRKSYKPAHTESDLILGSKKVPAKYDSCGVARIGTTGRDHNRCGEAGLWWEPKNKRDLFKFIKHVSV